MKKLVILAMIGAVLFTPAPVVAVGSLIGEGALLILGLAKGAQERSTNRVPWNKALASQEKLRKALCYDGVDEAFYETLEEILLSKPSLTGQIYLPEGDGRSDNYPYDKNAIRSALLAALQRGAVPEDWNDRMIRAVVQSRYEEYCRQSYQSRAEFDREMAQYLECWKGSDAGLSALRSSIQLR